MAGAILFGIGIISQAAGLVNTGFLGRKAGTIVSVLAIGFMGVSAIPSSLGLYLLAVITIIIYSIIASAFFRSPAE